jgi:glucokinase
LAIVAADAIGNAITLFDAPVVIGGGLSGAHEMILPKLVDSLNSKYHTFNGKNIQRMEVFAYNWHNKDCRNDFLTSESSPVQIPGTNESIHYDPLKKVAVGVSQLGTTKAVALGAYAFAIIKLNERLQS